MFPWGCGEIGLPHWVWCRKQDFQVVASRSVTWQDRLSPVGVSPADTSLRSSDKLLSPQGPPPCSVLKPAACSLWGVHGGSSVRGGSGWSFQMPHQCLDCWHCSSTLFVCTYVHDLRFIVSVWHQVVTVHFFIFILHSHLFSSRLFWLSVLHLHAGTETDSTYSQLWFQCFRASVVTS